ncbi:hypothetical protein B9Z55_020247 [Caenorhabditis nigoni]|uniref:Uncharacterized protein n=1 Tax=Caenorhabditis nigoni TaxID=1611254 RepID=A0A2G5TLZ2_9PELO|nr:hypothetical protein B9Z55_020247 [Caenorhabditis nigoni]
MQNTNSTRTTAPKVSSPDADEILELQTKKYYKSRETNMKDMILAIFLLLCIVKNKEKVKDMLEKRAVRWQNGLTNMREPRRSRGVNPI